MNDLDHYLSHSDVLISDISDDYLEHHGILGMKWGKQNGPPYPLSDKIHDRVVKAKEKHKENRRKKILKDPKKLYKHSDEFTTEELDTALAKIDARNRVKERIPQKEKKEKKEKEVRLSLMKRHWAKSAKSLDKHVNRYKPEELKKALDILDGKHRVYDKKMSEIDRPRRMIQVGADYIGAVSNVIRNIKGFKDLVKKDDPFALTAKDKRKLALNDLEVVDSIKNINPNDMEQYARVLGEKYGDKNNNFNEEKFEEYLKKYKVSYTK